MLPIKGIEALIGRHTALKGEQCFPVEIGLKGSRLCLALTITYIFSKPQVCSSSDVNRPIEQRPPTRQCDFAEHLTIDLGCSIQI